MEIFNQSYEIGMPAGATMPRIHLSQYDSGNTFTLRIFSHGRPATLPEGVTAKIAGRKPSGNAYTYNAEISLDRDAVIVTVTEQMTVEKGESTAEIVFLGDGGSRCGSCNFVIVVEPSPVDGAAVSGSDFAAIYEAISAAENAAQYAADAAESATAAETAAERAEAAAATATADAPLIVPIAIAQTGIYNAIQASQTSGRPEAIAASAVTADASMVGAIRQAVADGKRVRFDLTIADAGSNVYLASAEAVAKTNPGRDHFIFAAAFDGLGMPERDALLSEVDFINVAFETDGGVETVTATAMAKQPPFAYDSRSKALIFD